jgi:Domain of unknown function (DUF4430)/LPXTG cell wall anchor motif/Prenyltransferase and squalene oxidase repeat
MNKRKMTQRFIALSSIMILVIIQVLSFLPQQINAAALTNGATITVVDQDDKKIVPMTAVEVEEGQTAFDILKEVTEEQEVALDYSIHEQFGPMIEGIGKVAPEGYDYWGFIINGEEAQVGASSYAVEKGDSLLFKIISYPAEKVNITVSAMDSLDQSIFNETVQVVKGSSAFDALKLAGKTTAVKVDAAIDPVYWAYINNIGEAKLGDYEYWSTYMNENYMTEGLSSYLVKEGDHLKLTVESSPPTDNDTGEEEGETPDTGGETPEGENGQNPAPTLPPAADPVTEEQVAEAIQSATQFISKKGVQDEFGAIAIKAAGKEIPKQYIDSLKKSIISNEGNYRNVTDYERIVLALTAAGINAANFAGYDLIEKIHSNERMTNQGNNGVIYALLALDSGNYDVPNDAKWTRDDLVNHLLEQQLKDGGWSLYGSKASVDITGMALTALAPYKGKEKVQAAIDQAVAWLSSVQDDNGGFSDDSNGGDASETTAQVIIGLASVGINPTEERFTKQPVDTFAGSLDSPSSGINLIQHLLTFKQDDGGFAHLQGGESDMMASSQALLALASYDNKGSIYQFTEPIIEVAPTLERIDDKDETPIVDKNEGEKPTKQEAQQNIDTVVKDEVENTNENKVVTKSEGHKLPNTATPSYNLLATGGALLVIGSTVLIYTQRRQAKKA